MADKITFKNGNNSVSVYSSSKVDSLKSDTDSKISSINGKLSTMGTADNISALDKRLKSVEGDYAKKSDIPTTLPASDVSAWAKASSKPSYSWGEISNKPTNFITSGNIGSQTVSKAGTLIDNSNAGWNVAASWMHSSKSSVGLNDYISVMEATGSNTALIYTAQAKNVKVGSAASADSVAWSNVTGKPSSFPPSSHNHDDRYSITRRGEFYSNGKYVNLGTFSFDGGQAGQYCFIQIFTGSGYNGQVEQDEAIDVHFRIGNGTSEAGYAESHGNGHNECTVYYVKNSNSSYTFYLGKTYWTGWSFYEAKCYGTFKISGAEADSLPSGAVELEKKVIAWKSDIPAALPDVHGLHIGSKYFNGSASTTIYASDLDALTRTDTNTVKTDYASYNSDTMNGVRLTTNNGANWYFQFAAGIVDFPAGSNYRSKSVSFSGSGGNPFYGTSGTVKVVVSEVAKDGYSGSGSGGGYNAVKAYGVSNSGFTIYCAPGDAVSVNWIAFKLS